MEKINDLRTILTDAIRECCKYADCDTMERIFDAADWTWTDLVTDESYHPSARDIRNTLYDLGKSSRDSLMKDYNGEDFQPKPYKTSSGRLYFSIDFDVPSIEKFNFMRHVVFNCGILTEAAITSIDDFSQNDYIISTYDDDEEYRVHLDR